MLGLVSDLNLDPNKPGKLSFPASTLQTGNESFSDPLGPQNTICSNEPGKLPFPAAPTSRENCHFLPEAANGSLPPTPWDHQQIAVYRPPGGDNAAQHKSLSSTTGASHKHTGQTSNIWATYTTRKWREEERKRNGPSHRW